MPTTTTTSQQPVMNTQASRVKNRESNIENRESKEVLDESPSSGQNSELQENTPVRELPAESPMKKKIMNPAIILSVVAILAGLLTGYGVFRLQNKSGGQLTGKDAPISQVAGDQVAVGDVFGSPDTETFKDSAQGYLEAGGIDGEGSHKLLREGGETQTVYLTSSVTDLDKLVGMEVEVWGETFKAQKAGWLMDVGRVEVVKLDAQVPTEE